MQEFTPCVGRYHGMRYHQEVSVPFCCHALSPTFVLPQATHRRGALRLSVKTIEKPEKPLHPPSLYSPLRRVEHRARRPSAARSHSASTLSAYRDHTAPQAACFHRFRTIAKLDLDEPFGHDDTQTRFHAHFGQIVQLSGHRGRLAVVAEPQSHVCLSAEENSHFDTSKYVVATNDLRKCLNYERLASFSPVLDVRACDGDDSMIANAPTMTTPQIPSNNASMARIHGLKTRWRLRGTSGSMLDKEERITCVPFFLHSPLLAVQCTIHLCVPTGLGSGSLGHRNPLVARHRPVYCPSHGGVHALEGRAQGGQLTESIEQVDLHRVN